MGTRSLTKVYRKGLDSEVLVSMFGMYDGYFEGMGKDLQEFLDGMVIVNGIGMTNPPKIANGMDCLAAQLVAKFKTGAGGFYLAPNSQSDEGYSYHIYKNKKDELCLKGVAYGKTKNFKLSKPKAVEE